MKSTLQVRPHNVLADANTVDVLHNGVLVCTIVGADGPGVRIISKHINDDFKVVIFQASELAPGVCELRFVTHSGN